MSINLDSFKAQHVVENDQGISVEIKSPKNKPNLATFLGNKEFEENDYLSLLSKESNILSEYIFNKFSVNSVTENVSNWKKAPLIIASSVSIICGYVSWYPIILGVMDIGIESKVIKIIFAGGSWISYGSLYAWGTLKIVQDLFKKHTSIEASLMKNTTHPFLSALYKGSIVVLGGGATLPNAYFAYIFNGQNIAWTLVNIGGSWGLCAYSINKMIVDFYIPRWQFLKPFCSESFFKKVKWNEVREFIVMKLRHVIEKTPEMDNKTISQIFEQIDSTEPTNIGTETKKKYTETLFTKIFYKYKEEVRNPNPDPADTIINSKWIKYPVKFISAILPISNIYSNAKATFDLVGKFTDLAVLKVIILGIALSLLFRL